MGWLRRSLIGGKVPTVFGNGAPLNGIVSGVDDGIGESRIDGSNVDEAKAIAGADSQRNGNGLRYTVEQKRFGSVGSVARE